MPKPDTLSRREREMMNILFRSGKASATEVMEGMADPPSYSAVRATLRVLEQKGHVRHQLEGARYVYSPTVNRERAGVSALDHLLNTFFEGSAASVVATLIGRSKDRMTDDELERISDLIRQARREGR